MAASSSATNTGPTSTVSPPTASLIAAIRPPEAFIPMRNGKENFSSNNPGPGAQAPEAERSRDRATEQPGLRRDGADAGWQIPGRDPAERDAPGWRQFVGDAAEHANPLLRYRRPRSSEAGARARRAAAVLQDLRRQDPRRRAKRIARARRDPLPAARPRQQQRLWLRDTDLALPQDRHSRHLQRDQYRRFAI